MEVEQAALAAMAVEEEVLEVVVEVEQVSTSLRSLDLSYGRGPCQWTGASSSFSTWTWMSSS